MTQKREISSIIKATAVIKCLSAGDTKLSDISRKISYDKSTVHRILRTLEKVGFARQDPITKHFYPGPLFYSISDDFLKTYKLLNMIARQHMETLRDRIMETVNLQISMGFERIVVEIVYMVRKFMPYVKLGNRFPIIQGAAGKVLLSMLKDNDLMVLLDKLMLLPSSKELSIDKVQIIQEIRNVRIQGHAIHLFDDPFNGGAFSVPVKNYICPVSLTVVGVTESQGKQNEGKILKEIKKTSKKISDELAIAYKSL